KIEKHRDIIDRWECVDCEDADILVAAIGISARAARAAVRAARRAGIAAGLFRPVTLWPFPAEALREAARTAKTVIVPEMNAGQLVREGERHVGCGRRVVALDRIDGEPAAPAQILDAIEEASRETSA
ncbi:MAG TPA: 2-oxoacid:acceptor oxidoreductase subunit alpha, partial [Thermopetrobacter sp.]|nr:2-oxoacid:acceptor oxidoreductase subunit alpha [Thermopetrobacter sp.]